MSIGGTYGWRKRNLHKHTPDVSFNATQLSQVSCLLCTRVSIRAVFIFNQLDFRREYCITLFAHKLTTVFTTECARLINTVILFYQYQCMYVHKLYVNLDVHTYVHIICTFLCLPKEKWVNKLLISSLVRSVRKVNFFQSIWVRSPEITKGVIVFFHGEVRWTIKLI